MSKTRSALIGVIIGVILIIASILVAKAGGLLSVIEDRDVYQPLFLSASCVPIDGLNLNQNQKTSHTDNPTWYYCDDTESNTFIPDGTQCKYIIENADALATSVYICEGKTTNKDDLESSRCEKVSGFTTNPNREYSVDAGDSIYINTFKTFGDASLFVEYPAYGLSVETSTGYDLRTTSNCLIRDSLKATEHTLNSDDVVVRDRKNREVVALNNPLNLVQGQTNVRGSGQVVSLSDVDFGSLIYILEPGRYYKVLEAEDGFLYTDTTKLFSDSDIECIPRTSVGGAYCSDDAKLVSEDQVTCSTWSGNFGGYNPSDKPGFYCLYECVDNKPVQTSDCKRVTNDCPEDKPYWNFEEQKCEGQLPPTVIQQTNYPLEAIIIVAAIFLIALLMIAVKVRQK